MTTAAASSAGLPATGGPPSGEEPGSVQVSQEGETIVIVVRDHLDASVGAALVDAATAAVGSKGAKRLDIDLRSLDSYTVDGADALVACRALGAQLVDGLHYRTGRGAGRSALLSAYRATDTGEMQAIQLREADGTSTDH